MKETIFEIFVDDLMDSSYDEEDLNVEMLVLTIKKLL